MRSDVWSLGITLVSQSVSLPALGTLQLAHLGSTAQLLRCVVPEVGPAWLRNSLDAVSPWMVLLSPCSRVCREQGVSREEVLGCKWVLCSEPERRVLSVVVQSRAPSLCEQASASPGSCCALAAQALVNPGFWGSGSSLA